MRNKLSWVIGIAAFILFMIIVTYSAKYMELPLDSDLGVIVTLLAGFLANKIYIFIKQIEPPYEDILTSNCWILGLTLMMVITGLIYKAFEHSYSDLSTYLRYALQINSWNYMDLQTDLYH